MHHPSIDYQSPCSYQSYYCGYYNIPIKVILYLNQALYVLIFIQVVLTTCMIDLSGLKFRILCAVFYHSRFLRQLKARYDA